MVDDGSSWANNDELEKIFEIIDGLLSHRVEGQDNISQLKPREISVRLPLRLHSQHLLTLLVPGDIAFQRTGLAYS